MEPDWNLVRGGGRLFGTGAFRAGNRWEAKELRVGHRRLPRCFISRKSEGPERSATEMRGEALEGFVEGVRKVPDS